MCLLPFVGQSDASGDRLLVHDLRECGRPDRDSLSDLFRNLPWMSGGRRFIGIRSVFQHLGRAMRPRWFLDPSVPCIVVAMKRRRSCAVRRAMGPPISSWPMNFCGRRAIIFTPWNRSMGRPRKGIDVRSATNGSNDDNGRGAIWETARGEILPAGWGFSPHECWVWHRALARGLSDVGVGLVAMGE